MHLSNPNSDSSIAFFFQEEVCEAKSEAVMVLATAPTAVEQTPLVPQPPVEKQKKSSIFKSRFNSSQASAEKSASVKGDSSASSKGKKGLALYRHKWHEDDAVKGATAAGETVTSNTLSISGTAEGQLHSHPSPWDDLGDEPEGPPPKAARLAHSTSTNSFGVSSKVEEAQTETSSDSGLRCPRKTKDYYTVVRNVKKAHQIQESGEFQEFNDDVDYILDALQDRNPTATR